MRRLASLFLVLSSLLLGGCLYSIFPFYTAEGVVFEKSLSGHWSFKDKDEEVTLQFETFNPQAYRLIVRDEKKKESRLIAVAFRMDGKLFLDLHPELIGDELGRARVHTLMQVQSLEPLRLQGLSYKYVSGLLEKQPGVVPHVRREAEFFFTAPPSVLQDFLRKHCSKPEAWGDLIEFKRVTK